MQRYARTPTESRRSAALHLLEGERPAGYQLFVAAKDLERSPKTTQPSRTRLATSGRRGRFPGRRRPAGCRPGRCRAPSDQRSAAPPTRHAEAAAARPAEIDHEGLQARFEDAEAHAKGAMVKPGVRQCGAECRRTPPPAGCRRGRRGCARRCSGELGGLTRGLGRARPRRRRVPNAARESRRADSGGRRSLRR